MRNTINTFSFEKTNKQKELEDLFVKWIDYYQKNEKQWFIKDGFINFEDFDSQKGILFMLKEANLSNSDKSKDSQGLAVENQIDWINNYLLRKTNSKMLTKISRLYSIISEKSIITSISDPQILKKCAFMNINKEGGSKRTKDNRMKGIIENFSEIEINFIKDEIRIINPKIVVFGCVNLLECFLKKIYGVSITTQAKKNNCFRINDTVFIGTYHFSVIGYDSFYNQIKGINI